MKKATRLFVAAAVLGVAWLAYFALTPMALPATPYEFTVNSGSGLKAVARQLANDGVLAEPESLWIVARLLGRGQAIKAGTYRLERATTPLELIDKMERGDVVLDEILFVEGSTLRQWLAQLAAQPKIRQTLAGKSEMDLRGMLGEIDPLEGWFFPDTYRYAPGTTDLDILKRAHAAMKKKLDEAWAARDPGIVLATPYEALTMASIVEKETGQGVERPIIASVFENRLRRGMRLQTDPTVIYGLGERYDGAIHKRDLLEDTPWNTYTRDGLPPTPIAMPGAASIRAVLHPASTPYLYFVARGDGTHEFTASLEEHNRAVAKYQLGK
ncbi:MAG TPA: endolytic transglycosylase MltG [Usitatibacter sp.]|nr:endolytic transglycosylase MltG [Usitatibacter sp.]